MDYRQERFDSLAKHYRVGLSKAMQEHPDQYMKGSDADTVADKMMTAIKNNGIRTVNVNSKGFKNACKTLSIKPTYKAIEAFLNGQ